MEGYGLWVKADCPNPIFPDLCEVPHRDWFPVFMYEEGLILVGGRQSLYHCRVCGNWAEPSPLDGREGDVGRVCCPLNGLRPFESHIQDSPSFCDVSSRHCTSRIERCALFATRFD